MSERTQVDYDALEWLHVYGQYSYHSEATIRGTIAGLTALREAISKALEGGKGCARVIASDGEGYSLQVLRVNTQAALGHPEYLFELEYEMGKREAERKRQIAKRLAAETP